MKLALVTTLIAGVVAAGEAGTALAQDKTRGQGRRSKSAARFVEGAVKNLDVR